MIKKTIIAGLVVLLGSHTIAQQRGIPPTYSDDNKTEMPKGFHRENIFLGGGLALGFGSYSFNIGGTPEIGYSFSEWLDAGVALNINYQSVRADPYYNYNVRQRSLNYGGGPFFRLYPLKQFFIQGQFEENWIKYNYLDINSNQSSSFSTQSGSLLAGIGYSQRIIGQSSFYTVLMIDLLTDKYSPYRSYNGVTNTAIPIIRAGFNFYLRPKKQK